MNGEDRLHLREDAKQVEDDSDDEAG